MTDFRVTKNDPALGEICSVCNREIRVGDVVHLVETFQKRGDIEFNVDYVYYHSGCH